MASRRASGFTLLELVVVVCLVSILASVGLERFLRYQEIAEKAAMQSTVAAMRSALAIQASVRLARSGFTELDALAGQNPVDWLARPPEGYLGALFDPRPGQVAKGTWYFDLRNNDLVYTPERTRFFHPDPQSGGAIRFKVILRVEAQGSAGVRELAELDVRSTQPISWSPEF